MLPGVDPLSALPASFPAGTTVLLTRSHSSYPASAGWALTLYLAGPSIANAGGAPAGDAFTVDLTAAITATLVPGRYQWSEKVVRAGEVRVAAAGFVTVTRDLATAAAGDAQTWEEKTLAVVEAAIAGALESGMESYQIAGRSVTRYSLEDLKKLRGELVAAVRTQRNGGRLGRQHAIEFRPTS